LGLYDDILRIARNYLGPAAEDYVRRRIRIVTHGAIPESVTGDRIERLAAGIDMTAKVYMGPIKAAAFRDDILALRDKYPPPPTTAGDGDEPAPPPPDSGGFRR
jgi:hypothetical protein